MDLLTPIAQASSGITDTGVKDAGKAIALGVGAGLGSIGAGIGIGFIFGQEVESAARRPRWKDDLIVAAARRSADATKTQATDEGREKREELLAAARRDIEAETRRSLERIRKEVADLTVLTTEKVTRKTLTGDDQKRLIDEALAEVDFSALSGSGTATEEAPA